MDIGFMKKFNNYIKISNFIKLAFPCLFLYACTGGTSSDSSSTGIQLNWEPPSFRNDGSSLNPEEIDSYIIRYGQNLSSLVQSITINDSQQTSHNIESLASGRWYFTIETVDIQQQSSSPTTAISIDL